ncbi:MAG TPA: hypothetical protein VJN64_12540 [Terriglobales bacterium]|nr:hypothetical protein [Terriglobales bacterium]
MFSRKLSIGYESSGKLEPCPLKWLDNFAMRNFTNDPIFDDTLPISDGVLEIGSHVPLDRLKSAMEDWFQRKGYLPKGSALVLKNL